MNVKRLGLWLAILWVAVGILIIVLPNILNWLLGAALILVGAATFFRK